MYGMLSNNPLHFPGLHKVPSTSCVYSIPSCNPLPHRQAAAKPPHRDPQNTVCFPLCLSASSISRSANTSSSSCPGNWAIILPSGPATRKPAAKLVRKIGSCRKKKIVQAASFKIPSHRFLAGTLHAAGQNIILAPLSAAIRAGSGNSKS